MGEHISYAGLTEAEVVVALYHGTGPLGMGALHDNPGFGLADADRVLDRPRYGGKIHFDYVCGRPFKVTLDTERKVIESGYLYDRDAKGEDSHVAGECARVIAAALAAKGG